MSPKQCPGGRRSASSGAFLLWGQSRGSGVEVRPTRLAGGPDGVEQKVCPIGIDWKEQLKSIFSVLGLLAKIPPNRPSGRRRFCAVNSEPPREAENCSGAALPTPSIQIPKGGGRLRRPEPKTKGHPYGCPFVLVREAGVEPARPCEHWHLKPASLPIPPLAHIRRCFSARKILPHSFPRVNTFSNFFHLFLSGPRPRQNSG